MRKWWLAALFVGLLSVVAIASSRPGVRNFVRVFLASAPIDSTSTDRALVSALTSVAANGGRQVHMLARSGEDDERVVRAATRAGREVSMVPRHRAAIERAVAEGELLARQRDRSYLELFGYELEWLPQPAGATAFPLLRVKRQLHCASVRGDRWSFLQSVEYTGRVGLHLPAQPNGEITFVIGDEIPLDIEVLGIDDMPIVVRREELPAGPAGGMPTDFWAGDGNPWRAPGAVTRLTVSALPVRERLASIRLGRRAPRVLARLRNYPEEARARVCAASIGIEDAFETSGTLVIMPRTPEYFGTGWYGAELAEGRGEIRWMKRDAAVLVPSQRRGEIEVQLRGSAPPGGREELPMTLNVNDVFSATATPRPNRAYTWTIPASAWVSGTNELLFSVRQSSRVSPSDTREVGFALQSLRLEMRN